MSRSFCDRHSYTNQTYPCLTIHYTEDDKSIHGFSGECVRWLDGNTKDLKCNGRIVRIYQTSPIGHIYIDLDPHEWGARRCTNFSGVDITIKDLQWVTKWAAIAIELDECYDKLSNRL